MLHLIYFCFNIVCPYGVFCATISRVSVSLLRFLFLSHVQVFSCKISRFVCGVFWDQGGLSFYHLFQYVCFFKASIHFNSQFVVDGSKFLKKESMYAIITRYFPIWYFLRLALGESRYIFAFGPSSTRSNSFSIFYPFDFNVRFVPFPYFAPKLFCLLVIRLLVCLHAFSSYLLLLFWIALFFFFFFFFCQYCFILSQYLFSLSSFASIF